ncbi:MAG: penicillin-binding protein 2 [Ruminococcus sp.]|uniref:peptidoglycan D,D-transpeptidase FtsI family protein n=1 Tax=Ruminococcus sp. TaxID=41978 RepID=UPI0025FB03BC|nr:penicillin-binding protein 2 [Ruminococcus sp.]MBR5682320.1 penicillin-binding protein 2 [Ruminococcus sp.]
MVRKRGENGVIILTALFFTAFVILIFRYYSIAWQQKNVSAAQLEHTFTIEVGKTQGTIYDHDLKPIINSEKELRAVAVPALLDCDKTAEYAIDKESFYKEFENGKPFVFRCSDKTLESDGLTVFEVPVRYSRTQKAQHIIGYLSEGRGADGIEYSYDSILRSNFPVNSVSYTTDGFGRILTGGSKEVLRTNAYKSGVVLTVDGEIQDICEKCGSGIDTGAIVCADITNGDILAMASFPDYDPENIEAALKDERSPLINRALYSYSVGSVFKLVTASAALEQGLGKHMYDCSGNIDVEGRNFNCHKLDGHGLQDMAGAMTNSCNTYFIDLARSLDIKEYRRMATYLGFGREAHLCSGIIGSGGVLPTEKELSVPAELANFSFGQGKLTATPLQITQLTCAIANKGKMPILRLIKGLTPDGEKPVVEKRPQISEVMSEKTAEKISDMMVLAVRENKRSKAKSRKVSVGAKTSTAQTGHYNDDDEELCHAWITGFFPAKEPKYAVTVLIENGGYGNDAAAPVFREIAEKITELGKKVKNNETSERI